MSKPLSWVMLVVVLLVSLATAYGAYVVAGDAWEAVVDYQSPYARLASPPSPATTPISRRVVLVIIDGLRLDAAREMSVLNRTGEYASDYVLTAPQPSLSYPNWTTILSGAPPFVSGVVTNWHEGAAGVDTLIDTARSVEATYVVVGPTDLKSLFPASQQADASFFKDWTDEYMAGTYVDQAIRLTDENDPRLVVLHIPDVDEAGHASGGTSQKYADVVARVDQDLRRLVESLQDPGTTFVFVADHGHIDTGGHGGWEDEAVSVRGVFSGNGVNLGTAQGSLSDVAPTVAVLAGLPVPQHSSGRVLGAVVNTATATAGIEAAARQHDEFARQRIDVVLGSQADDVTRANIEAKAQTDPDAALAEAEQYRLTSDRNARLPYGAAVIGVALLVIAAVALASWRAVLAAGAGSVAYYVSYNVLFFTVHGYRWSLSAFNSEDLITSWMNGRMLEAIGAGLVAAAVAAYVYPHLRKRPKGPRGIYLPGWLSLGPTTILVIQATLAMQAGWFLWWWGVKPTWILPDLKWAFKFDLDLVQMTALGVAAVGAPVVTYLVGRYHHKVKSATSSAE